MTPEERELASVSFWTMVRKSEGCWEWVGYVRKTRRTGYGVFFISSRPRHAHRIAWELANNTTAPADMMVCHHCDNRVCVRPDHLYLGTAKDNMQDRSRRGRCRAPHGSKCHLSKITEAQVVEIRRIFADPNPPTKAAVAARYGLKPRAVFYIVSRKTWAHVA